MQPEDTPLWSRLMASAREANAASTGCDQRAAGPLSPDTLTSLVEREVRSVLVNRHRERWLWAGSWLGLAVGLLAAISIDWHVMLPSDDCPLLTAQLVSEEWVP